jgi:hypothetical protein
MPFVSGLPRKCGRLDFSQPCWFPWPVTEITSLYLFLTSILISSSHLRRGRSEHGFETNVVSVRIRGLSDATWRHHASFCGGASPSAARVPKTNKTTSEALSPRANYTDWATATCQRNLVPTFVDRGVSRGQRGGSPTIVNLSFLDRSRYFSFK